MSMAVLTKLHIAYADYLSAQKLFDRDIQLDDVNRRIYENTANRVLPADAQGKLDRIATEVALVYSRLRRYESYGDVEGAVARVYETIGLDPAPQDVAAPPTSRRWPRQLPTCRGGWRTGKVLVDLQSVPVGTVTTAQSKVEKSAQVPTVPGHSGSSAQPS